MRPQNLMSLDAELDTALIATGKDAYWFCLGIPVKSASCSDANRVVP